MAAGHRDCREWVREKWQSGSQGGPRRAASAQNTKSTGPCGGASSGQRICGGKLETVGRLVGVEGGREPLASRGQRYLVQGFRMLADRPHPLAGDMNRQPCLARLPQ